MTPEENMRLGLAAAQAVLGVSQKASPDEIKSAYRQKAREHHPDRGGSREWFVAVKMAYDLLIGFSVRPAPDVPVGPVTKDPGELGSEKTTDVPQKTAVVQPIAKDPTSLPAIAVALSTPPVHAQTEQGSRHVRDMFQTAPTTTLAGGTIGPQNVLRDPTASEQRTITRDPGTPAFGNAKAWGINDDVDLSLDPGPDPPTAPNASAATPGAPPSASVGTQPRQPGITKDPETRGFWGALGDMAGNAAEYATRQTARSASRKLQKEFGPLIGGFAGGMVNQMAGLRPDGQQDRSRQQEFGSIFGGSDEAMASTLNLDSDGTGFSGGGNSELLTAIKLLTEAVENLTDSMKKDKTTGGLDQATGVFTPTLNKSDDSTGGQTPNVGVSTNKDAGGLGAIFWTVIKGFLTRGAA